MLGMQLWTRQRRFSHGVGTLSEEGGQVNRQQTHRQVKKKTHKHMPEGGRQEVEAGYAVRCGGSSVCPGESFLIK